MRRHAWPVVVAALMASGAMGQSVGFADSRGVPIHYVDWGGRGQVLLMLPEVNDTAWVYQDIAPTLAERYRVISVTRRGCGLSGKPADGYDLATLSDDLVAVMDSLRIERAHLVGHGYAADELNLLSRRHPARVASLIYIDGAVDRTSPFFSSAFMNWDTRTVPEPVQYSSVESFIETVFGTIGMGSAGLRRNALDRIEVRDEVVVERCTPKTRQAILFARARYRPLYESTVHPALALYVLPSSQGARSPLEAKANANVRPHYLREISRLQAAGTHVRTVAYEGGSHYMFVDRRSAVVREISAFVEGVG